MTTADELRRMLDERGVSWDYGITGAATTRYSVNGIDLTFTPMRDGLVCSTILTPEQAIEATLGRGECRLVRHGSLADWPEMVCWSCSVCCFGWHHDTNDKQFSYCPNCGRKVVDE